MSLPGWRDWVFSLKTFAGAMLALWLAFRLDLDRPYWAMATAYIVAQPLTGAMRSKSAYRFAGTLIGACVTLVLVPNLVDAPVLLVAAFSLWIGGCIYVAVLDRTPRSYLFLLAGYTVAIIGFPAVDTPGAIWDTVLARVEEITLGILSTTLVGTLILPRPLGPALARRIDCLMDQAQAASLALLSGLPDTPAARAGRRRLAADAVEIAGLSSHLAYDISALQDAVPAVNLLYQRVILLLAVLSGIADRMCALRDLGGLTPALRQLLGQVSAWIGARDGIVEGAVPLRAAIDRADAILGQPAGWTTVLHYGLLMRLRELVDIGHDIAALRRSLDEGHGRLPSLALPRQTGTPRHRDHFMAAYSGLAAMLAIALVCAFWIATAWPEGSGAAGLVAVACSFFATQDDPVPSIVKFLVGALVALALDTVLLFAILPQAEGFEMLALALAPPYLLLGAFMAQPQSAAVAGPIAFMSATLMALTANYAADFTAFVNGAAATVVGLAAAAVVLRLVRSVGAGWAALRLLRTNRADIAAAATHAGTADRLRFAALMLDRLGGVMPRLAASAEGADDAARAALADIRVGINIVDLQQEIAGRSGPAAAPIVAVLRGVAAHFSLPATTPDPGLLAAIDTAIGAAAARREKPALLALAGIRRALFRDAPPPMLGPAAPPAIGMAA